jgi:putative ABC transport system permease protein
VIPAALLDAWDALPAVAQDGVILAALLVPALATGAIVLHGFRPLPLVRAMLWRFRWTNLLFVLLIAVSVGLGVAVTAQERGIREGTARAAEKFDLVVGAPGSEMTLMLAAVYLRPADVPLLSGAVYDEIVRHPHVRIAAPIAFGDSFMGAPVVGTIPQFVEHLGGPLAEGRLFAAEHEAVAGALAPVAVGATFEPAHGTGDAAEHDAHEGAGYTVVGRMARTGSPWDRAILVPVEAVWEVHGLANGHGPDWTGAVGPPFDPALFPGTPAVLVRADELWANYALRSTFSRPDVMAFFPGAVLAELHALLGDIRQVMSVLALVTEVLVAAGVLAGLVVLTRLYGQRLALLAALGAPPRFAFAVVWTYATALIVAGALLGVLAGLVATAALSALITARTDILVTARLGWTEAHLVAGFVSLAVILAMLPALAGRPRDIVRALRA